jgi:hypothetical protein
MAYYPKSQIKTNLYTNGDELVYKNGLSPYSGYYWINSSGKIFTGKTPQDTPNSELIKQQSNFDEFTSAEENLKKPSILAFSGGSPYIGDDPNLYNEGSIISYTSLKNVPLNSTPITYLPVYSPNIPTEQDYQIGEYRRYFCKKTNEIVYLEISKETYDRLIGQDPQIAFQLYLPFNLPWQLTGKKEDVYKTNRNITELTSVKLKLPMLSSYLKEDFTKYYRG